MEEHAYNNMRYTYVYLACSGRPAAIQHFLCSISWVSPLSPSQLLGTGDIHVSNFLSSVVKGHRKCYFQLVMAVAYVGLVHDRWR